jgi:hypothetical protein
VAVTPDRIAELLYRHAIPGTFVVQKCNPHALCSLTLGSNSRFGPAGRGRLDSYDVEVAGHLHSSLLQ